MRRFGGSAIAMFLAGAGSALAQVAAGGGASASQPASVTLPVSGRNNQGGSVGVAQQPVAGTTTSVNTLNPALDVSGPYAGSARSTTAMPFNGRLSLADALRRGLSYNLGGIGMNESSRASVADVRLARSALLPNINSTISETVEQVDLAALGFRVNFSFPGVRIPTVVGPFNYFEAQMSVTQTLASFTAINNYRSARATARAGQYSLLDARDLVTLAVGGAYLQVLAAQARLDAAQVQLATANAVFHQSTEQHQEGVLGKLSVDQDQVRALTQQQQLITLRNDLAKQKINLARLTGLPPNPDYQLTDTFPFSPAPIASLQDALAQAFRQRSDLKAAQAQLDAANRALAAARAERLPSLSMNGYYGAIGANPANSHGVFSVTGSLDIPVWQGGRIGADIAQAQAVLAQRQAELEDTRGQVEAQVREVYLDLEAAAGQVAVSRKNLDVAHETLEMTRARMEAGVVNALEVVQAQQTLAMANLDLINSVFAYNLAKLNLARVLGNAPQELPKLLKAQTTP